VVDYTANNILLPLGGLLIALFAAWFLPKKIADAQLGVTSGFGSVTWRLLAGVVAPVCVAVVFAYTIFPEFIAGLLGF
jgi:NSS family neurotransmitter:Na+ symporter